MSLKITKIAGLTTDAAIHFTSADLRARKKLVYAVNENAFLLSRAGLNRYEPVVPLTDYVNFIDSQSDFLSLSLGRIQIDNGSEPVKCQNQVIELADRIFIEPPLIDVSEEEEEFKKDVTNISRPLNQSTNFRGLISHNYMHANMPTDEYISQQSIRKHNFRICDKVALKKLIDYNAYSLSKLGNVAIDKRASIKQKMDVKDGFVESVNNSFINELQEFMRSSEVDNVCRAMCATLNRPREVIDQMALDYFFQRSKSLFNLFYEAKTDSDFQTPIFEILSTILKNHVRNESIMKAGLVINPRNIKDEVSKSIKKLLPSVTASNVFSSSSIIIDDVNIKLNEIFSKSNSFIELLMSKVIFNTLVNSGCKANSELHDVVKVTQEINETKYVQLHDVAKLAIKDNVANIIFSYSNIGNYDFKEGPTSLAHIIEKSSHTIGDDVFDIKNQILAVWDLQRAMLIDEYRNMNMTTYTMKEDIRSALDDIRKYANYAFWLQEPKFLTTNAINYSEYAQLTKSTSLIEDLVAIDIDQIKDRVVGLSSRIKVYLTEFDVVSRDVFNSFFHINTYWMVNRNQINQAMLFTISMKPFNFSTPNWYILDDSFLNLASSQHVASQIPLTEPRKTAVYQKYIKNKCRTSNFTDEEVVILREIINDDYTQKSRVTKLDIQDFGHFGDIVRNAYSIFSTNNVNFLKGSTDAQFAKAVSELDIDPQSDSHYGTAFDIKVGSTDLLVLAQLNSFFTLAPVKDVVIQGKVVEGPFRLLYKVNSPRFSYKVEKDNVIRLSKGLPVYDLTYSPVIALFDVFYNNKAVSIDVKGENSVDTFMTDFDYSKFEGKNVQTPLLTFTQLTSSPTILENEIEILYPSLNLIDDGITFRYRDLINAPIYNVFFDRSSGAIIGLYENARQYIDLLNTNLYRFKHLDALFRENDKLHTTYEFTTSITDSLLYVNNDLNPALTTERIDRIIRSSLDRAIKMNNAYTDNHAAITAVREAYMRSNSPTRAALYSDITAELAYSFLVILCRGYEQRYVLRSNINEVVNQINEFRKYCENTQRLGIYIPNSFDNLFDDAQRRNVATSIVDVDYSYDLVRYKIKDKTN